MFTSHHYLEIEPHQQSENLYQLKFPIGIHPQIFIYLINYLAYPFDLNLTNRSIFVVGQATLNTGFEGVDPSLIGQKSNPLHSQGR